MKNHIALLVVVSLVLAACTSSTNPASTITVVQPKAGSTFTHEEFKTDTTTGDPIPASRETYTYSYARIGISQFGKTNVSEATNADDPTAMPLYINYESNGDVSLFLPSGETTGKWFLLPLSSKTTSTVIVVDTTMDFLGVQMKIKETLTTSYIGTENVTVKGQSISSVKIKQAMHTTITVAGSTNESTGDSFYFFAPSLGFLVKIESPVTTDQTTGSKYEGSLSTLIDYNLIK